MLATLRGSFSFVKSTCSLYFIYPNVWQWLLWLDKGTMSMIAGRPLQIATGGSNLFVIMNIFWIRTGIYFRQTRLWLKAWRAQKVVESFQAVVSCCFIEVAAPVAVRAPLRTAALVSGLFSAPPLDSPEVQAARDGTGTGDMLSFQAPNRLRHRYT